MRKTASIVAMLWSIVMVGGLLVLGSITTPVLAQPAFSRSGNGTFTKATMQGLRVGLGADSYQTVQPFNCPPAGQAPTIVSIICVGTQAVGGEEYMQSLSFNVTANSTDASLVASGSSVDKVGSYLGIQAFPGAVPTDVWARNTTVWAAPGFKGGIAGEELDLNNYECDTCDNHSFFGYWLSGGGSFPNRAGIYITGANANAAYQWHYGVQCVSEIKDACISDDTTNDGSNQEADFLRSTGHHTGVGLNLENGTYSGGAIGLASDQKIWMDGPNYTISLFGDATTGLTITGAVTTLHSKLAYGYLNSNGKHQSTAETLSSYGTGTNVMTPSSFAESASNNIGSISSGGMLVKGDVACQDGTNIASWTVSGLFLVSGSILTHVGTDAIVQTGNSSTTASRWTVQFGVDTVNNAPTLSSTINSTASATCTARLDAINVQ